MPHRRTGRTSSRKTPRKTLRKSVSKSPDKNQRAISDFFSVCSSSAKSWAAPASSSEFTPPKGLSHNVHPPSTSANCKATSTVKRSTTATGPKHPEHSPALLPHAPRSLHDMEIDYSTLAPPLPTARSREAENGSMEEGVPSEVGGDSCDAPLTQEELEVHDRFVALECSRDGLAKDLSPLERHGDSRPALLQKRMRTADVASDEDAVPVRKESTSTVIGPLAAAGLLLDAERERENISPTTQAEGSHARVGSDCETDESENDSYADLRKHDEALALRRSSRVSREVVRFDPLSDAAAKAARANIFGDPAFRGRQTTSSSAALKLMAKERSTRVAEDKKVAEMREGLGTKDAFVSEDELETMAKREDRNERERQAKYEKYAAPVPLFVAAPKMLSIPPKFMMRREDGAVHELHDILLEVLKAENTADIALSLVGSVIKRACRDSVPDVPFGIRGILFHLLVYDPTGVDPGLYPRDFLEDGLKCLIAASGRKATLSSSPDRLPTLASVLESYGARFTVSIVPGNKAPLGDKDRGLDGLSEGASAAATLNQCRRNLKRALRVAAFRVASGEKLYNVICRSLKGKDMAEEIVGALAVCTRVLLSTFGSQLYQEVGDLIMSLLTIVDRARWPALRFKAAKVIVSQTKRLGLHVELTTYLLPYASQRSRCLALDVAYLSLCQWTTKLDKEPQPNDICELESSALAQRIGLEQVSYTLSDVRSLLNGLSEIGKETDVDWACGLSRVLKQAVADRIVLSRRESGELGGVVQMIKKLRTCSHRMAFNVAAVQDVRIALDAVLVAVRDLLGESKAVRSELLPNGSPPMAQTRLPNVFS